jgi:HEAT repeat protein/glucose/arabinose dehydrogenase/mono/diheme cytochrome c family protein
MAACSLTGGLGALLLLAQGGPVPDTVRTTAAAESVAFRATVFARADQVPAPVALSIDDRGVVYTANSLRSAGRGHFDVRAWREILADDWRLNTVAERRLATQGWVLSGKLDTPGQPVTLQGLARYSEQVRRLADRNGDGVADDVSVWAAGMNELERGALAGVLAWGKRDVYATAIPELVAWRDSAGTGRGRRVLQSGFGVHMGQGGHDMHGLTMGLDGRLYWSIGDRGFALTTREGRKIAAHEGAVFRCWPDGSGLELFARGLRNPQELAFDDYGDLFTGDNNADVGDRSRWLYVPEGANGGWEYFLQFTPSCGPWLREHEWEPAFAPGDPAQPAWVLHPVAEAGSCPAGLAAYPGTGLPARYAGTLWLADFVGGVDAWRFAPEGAGFKLAEKLPGYHRSWGTCDVDFAPDGRVFVLYWGESWQPSDRARLLSLTPLPGADSAGDVARDARALVASTRDLLARGVEPLDDAKLASLLSHPDRRLRQRASLELGRRGRVDVLANVLATASEPRARLHALWGLNLAARAGHGAAAHEKIRGALAQDDPEVRRLAATLLGELGVTEAVPALTALLADPAPRVRFAAAQALARVGDARAIAPLERALAANADTDAFQRFACVRALAHAADTLALAKLNADADRSLRLAAVLALREARSEGVSAFLADADPQVATEAARASYDLFLPGAMHALAMMLPSPPRALRTEPWLRRALHAALRDGSPDAARGVAAYAAADPTPAVWREEALRVLLQWDAPDPRDGVWGRWAPLPPRATGLAHEGIAQVLPRLLESSDGDALLLAVELANREHVRVSNAAFLRWVKDETLDDPLRISAFGWLSARQAPELKAAEEAALASRSDSLFGTALAQVLARDPARGVATVEQTLASKRAPLAVRQAALRALAGSASPEATASLRTRWRSLDAGTLDSTLMLDVIETAARASDPALRDAARARLDRVRLADSLAGWAALLHGGDAARGRRLFDDPRAACVRCHALDGRGGTTGPDLSVIGSHVRTELARSLVTPAAQLAPGYPSTTMPPMGETLSAGELRDVVEFLAGRIDVAPDVPLGGLVAETAESAFGCVTVDRACPGGGLRVAGRDVARGVGVVSPARLVYAIPAGSARFVGRAGLDDGGRGGQVEFVVRVDGRVAWRSGPVRAGRMVRLSVPLPPAASRLELRVDDGGTAGGSAADWLDAGFTRAP